jgi:LacI family transcriptional regulator
MAPATIKDLAKIALTGFSNTHMTSLLDPPLTTVEQPSYEIGKTAAQ